MSIKKVQMFTIICDNCKKSADEGTDYAAWSCENGALEVAMEFNFIKEGDLHYCSDCYSYDDDDVLKIKEIIPKQMDYIVIKNMLCPACKKKMIIKQNMYYWKEKYLSGLVCEPCNALYDNPEDSFFEYVANYKK